jgi:opacity protein-like surface antigen
MLLLTGNIPITLIRKNARLINPVIHLRCTYYSRYKYKKLKLRGNFIMKKSIGIAMVMVIMLVMTSVGFAAPLSDYSAGKTSIDLTWRNSDGKSSGSDEDGSWETKFGKKSNLDFGITSGLGNNFAIQYAGYNAKSKDAVSWSDANETGIATAKLKTQEFNVLYKLNKNLSAYTGLVRIKAEENANVSYTDGSPSESESYGTKTKNAMQFGLIGTVKLAEKTTAYAQVGVASNFTNWKIGVSQAISSNLDFNVDYRGVKAKNLKFQGEDEKFDASAKGIGFGITYKF